MIPTRFFSLSTLSTLSSSVYDTNDSYKGDFRMDWDVKYIYKFGEEKL